MSKVAEKAGLERTHLYRKLKQLNIRFSRRTDETRVARRRAARSHRLPVTTAAAADPQTLDRPRRRRDRRRLRRHRHEPAVHAAHGVHRRARARADAGQRATACCRSCSGRSSIVVTLKYIMLIMRADNNGEGGILALTALVSRGLDRNNRRRWWLIGFGIFGAAMFYGDGMITPAISVLSAVEGLEIVAPALHPFVVPVTLVIIVALFAIQKRGTASVGAVLRAGDVPLVRRARAARRVEIVQRAGDPRGAQSVLRGRRSSSNAPVPAFLSLGAVVLAVTGTEALYADMGHFGRKPIRPRVALVRDARAGDQLLRAGRADPRRSRRRQESVLPARAVVGAASRWSCSRPARPSSRRRR